MLAAAIGTEPRIADTASGIRIEADLPTELTETAHTAVLAALATADHFGHTLTRTSEFVWAEISREATVTTTDSPDAAYRALLAHTSTCGACREGTVCPTATKLVRAWRETRA
ncbi:MULTISPECIES: hypothetical protein [Streptomyces]|uniref:Uncharacterized protein n=2 Tax=Streptomyces TaxID=1883 RepID=A0ABU2W879_9ACTN|nr:MULTISPECIES: hypothetical protein [Streptomyces]MDT0407122.1 hypothetical protein [Streptomyces sp. DSM 41635]MDT0494088.1 hypothetical protein [Streptomyces griseus]